MSLINPEDSLERQNEKLLLISQSLMRRVEQKTEQSGLAYQQFERAALLEAQVRERTQELERTLDLLQESNARLELANFETETARANLADAIETVDEGFALFDADDRLVLFNSRFCRDLLDIERDLAPGLLFADYVRLISESRFLSLPSRLSPADWAARRMRQHGEEHVVFNVSLSEDRWLQVSEHRTSAGGTVILQTDVTDIIRAERQERDKMRDRQARMLQATLDHLYQGVCIFDRKQMLVGWNKRMAGLLGEPTRRADIGHDFATLLDRLRGELSFHPGFDADRLSRWANRRSERKPIAFEVTRGEEQIFNVFAQEMPDKGFVISFTDVTSERLAGRALHEMNEQLEQRVLDRTAELGVALAEAERANASKSRFVAAASHDLLQPLSAAKLFLSSLTDHLDGEDGRDVLVKTETALQSAQSIIEALLDISKLDAGKIAFEMQPVRLSAIFSPLRDELGPVAVSKGLDIAVVDSGLTVRSDPGYLRRIVQNLLSNAIRYTDEGKVLLGVRRNGGSARIEVWDTGRGVAPADQAKIFQEFERLEPGVRNEGLGLGLAIVERASKGLGHDLSLWSEPGVGSCFSVNIPIEHEVEAQPAEADDANVQSGPSLTGLIVLLVENDPHFAAAMSLLIESAGAAVIDAKSAEEAIQLLTEIELAPDVMLLDYHLDQGADGVALYGEICAAFGRIPAAIVSADRSRAIQAACRRLSLPLLSKPVDDGKLLDFLAAAGEGLRPAE